MPPVSAPSKVLTNVAPQVFADPDIAFNDMDEQLAVTNLSSRPVIWRYAKQEWTLAPKVKPAFIKLAVCIKYLGDPRSAFGTTNIYSIPGSQRPGVVPERYAELRRLAIQYGIYEGSINKLATFRFRDSPRDRQDPGRDLWPDFKADDTIVPEIKVLTLGGHEVHFPIYEPECNPYRYETSVTGMQDVRTELEKMQRQYALLADKIENLEGMEATGDIDIPGAEVDSVGPPEA